ncbi:hypothetical protein PanWU01x14_316660 [Parasponia andersonii]|uniref:Transmembrane protein n=1 Tax=Parasponia andersonii TaxID=3476 RepID=A0A2P5AN28_PARAD|nr:hypothetical protein PanWU01x14_316660 [Parasponia andersonii]
MKAFLALISILLATVLFFPPLTLARELITVGSGTGSTINPGKPGACSRGSPSCTHATPKNRRPVAPVRPPALPISTLSPKPICKSIYKRNCPPEGH